MSGEYYESVALTRNSQAKAEDINTRTEGIQAGFDKLPLHHASAPTTKGFAEVFEIVPATTNLHPPTVKQIQEQGTTYGLDTGSSSNAFEVTMDPAVTAYTAGLSIKVRSAGVNTGPSTIDVNSLGAQAIKKFDGSALTGGEFVSGAIVGLTYDGENFQLDSWPTTAAALLDEDDMASDSASAAASQQSIVQYVSGTGFRSITASSAINATDQIIFADATSGNITITPESAASMTVSAGRTKTVLIKRTDTSANQVSVTGVEGGTVNLVGAGRPFIKIASDGTTIYLVG